MSVDFLRHVRRPAPRAVLLLGLFVAGLLFGTFFLPATACGWGIRFHSSGPEEPYPVPQLPQGPPVRDRYHPATYLILAVVLIFIVWIYFRLEKDPKSE